MTPAENGPNRRSLLAGAAGLGAAFALPAGAAQAAPDPAHGAARRYPPNWPDPAPYGLADTREDLWPREDNSFVLPLELRPRDEERGTVWMRDTYVNCFDVGGRTVYVATGTTRVPWLEAAAPWNDGIFVWLAPSLRGPWRLADTTGIRPGAEKGKVWSPEFAGENRPGRTVVAPWQEYWYDDRFGKRGQAWAPELHHFRGTWYIVACMGDHSRKVGSFMLVSEGGVEGPYRLVEGNREKPFGDSFIGGPSFIEPGAYHHIDGSLYSEGDDAWLVLHNDLYARFRDDMEDIVPATDLPRFRQTPYSPSRTSRARTCSSTGAGTTWSTPRGTVRHATPTAARGTPTTRPARAARSTSTTRSSPSRTASRGRTPSGGPRGWARGTTTSSPTAAETCGRRSSATPTSGTGPTRRASTTPPCPGWCAWSGPGRGTAACT